MSIYVSLCISFLLSKHILTITLLASFLKMRQLFPHLEQCWVLVLADLCYIMKEGHPRNIGPGVLQLPQRAHLESIRITCPTTLCMIQEKGYSVKRSIVSTYGCISSCVVLVLVLVLYFN